jgi:PAS domain S-box-containing protein
MPPVTSTRIRLLQYGCLAPFGVLALYASTALLGWLTGSLALAQPRSYDAVLPANACACLALLGLAPIALILGWKRTGLTFAALAALLAWATLLQDPLELNLGIDNLFVRHESLVAGSHVGRMPVTLSSLLMLAGLAQVWLAMRPVDHRRPVLLALLGSLAAAYGLTSLLGYRIGLNSIEAWQTYARLGPHTAVMLILLGTALILLAALDTRDEADAGPRWLWLPIVVCSATVTVAFWIALRQRELDYTNNTTQLTINNIAALFSGETEAHISSLSRMARHWTKAGGTNQADWEADAAEYMQAFEGYRSIQWVDRDLHTRWFWPRLGHEDLASYNHGEDPVRLAALQAARKSLDFAVAAPLDSPLQSPAFAVYAPILRGGAADGFIVGEFYYDKFFDTIERRLNLSRRYQLNVTVANPSAHTPAGRELKVFETMATDEGSDGSRRQSAVYNLFTQRMTISLGPRPAFLESNRQYLPELALFSGFGVSVLLGLVINLAQSALLRQRAAERTSEQLREENEERRRVEARLKATDERLTLALESTQVGVYEWHVESDQVFCTPSIMKMIGYEAATMPVTGQGWLELLHDEDRAAVRAVIDAHFRGESPFIEIEQCILHGSGEWIWIALRAKCTSFSATRQPLRVLGTIQNINARKRADEALRASQAATRKLSLVASKTENAVIITDRRGDIEWVNESFSRLTGRRLTEVARQPLIGLLASPEAEPGAVERISAALQRREPVSLVIDQLATDDRRFHVQLDVQPVFGDEGEAENFIVIETDITARVETERSLRRAKADADAASRAKSEFLASMSHEIRTPMNGVIGMTSLMLETELTAEQRDYINTIRTSGDALLSIINEILDFSKIESGKMELECQPFELSQCIEEAIDLFALQAAAKDIELAYHISPAVPAAIMGDITRLRQIIVNLMNNAVKFTARGFVTIEVSTASPPADHGAGGMVLLDFYVSDTGIGIPTDRLGLLFKPFSQVDSSTTRKYGGTGLGLAICDRLSQLMGGSIDVQSTPGAGSRFHFTIQTVVVDLTDASAPPLFSPIPGDYVLAVDDHAVNRAMLKDCLTAWKLKPRIAADATEALRLAHAGRLSAAIIDQHLDGSSGLDLVNRLRITYPKLPIILFTRADEGARRTDSKDPLIFHLPKPIKPYMLHDTLKHVIHGSQSSASTGSTNTGVAVRLADTIPLEILLVEDNLVNQKVALRYLERMGYAAATAMNGLEGFKAVAEGRFRLVFMDMQMPEMDGLEATREIRTKLPKEQQPIIVALTANAMQGDRERCISAGMDDYITKPIKIEDIQEVIGKFFGAKPG